MITTSLSDPTRASRDGHEFHEAWVARVALRLILSSNRLAGIAVEGLHPIDQATAKSETVEIADVVLYLGKRPTFDSADKVRIIQCKYSISHADKAYRASDAKNTISKFAITYLDSRRRNGAKNTQHKLEFELVTNRPVLPAFEWAIAGIAAGKHLYGLTRTQAEQFIQASGLTGKLLVEFAEKFRITGRVGSLSDAKKGLSRTIVAWSAADDAFARARLGQMRQMVRDKAGSAGTGKNVIVPVDVLAALEIGDVSDLLPCPASLPKVGKVVPREQLAEAAALFGTLEIPLLVHAAGGIGKTVFLASLAELLSSKHEVLLFDCFGGGRYRAPEDSRHLPRRGLIHIANTLAGRGLCDPLLPGTDSVESLVGTFRRRLLQCTKTLSITSPGSQLVLIIDAIDNAAEYAKERNEQSFPTLLLQSIQHGGSIPGVNVIVSCRSHRIQISTGGTPYHEIKLRPFSLAETELYVRDRVPKATTTEIQVAQARSAGNARILEHLVTSDRGLLDPSETEKKIELDDLLNSRIERALSVAAMRGYDKKNIQAFLAGLSTLPPPVPIDEYAGAQGMDVSAIESFAADLAPLLEQTKYGLMFRDEPTETLIRERFGSDKTALRRVAKNLLDRQDSSVYAARALPALLQRLDNGNGLFDLAFDDRFPKSITSLVGKRKIQYARLRAAALHSAKREDYSKLVHLLVALSTIATVDQKGANYILDYPDMVIAAQDVDATRRLFETRTSWPGTRHARLCIANALSGDLNGASRHATSAAEWIFHYVRQDDSKRFQQAGPERLDIAAIPLCLVMQGRSSEANSFMRRWKPWYAYEVAEQLFGLLRQAESSNVPQNWSTAAFLESTVDGIGMLTAALSFPHITNNQKRELIKRLSNAATKEKTIETDNGFHQGQNYLIQEGLLKAAVLAAGLGLTKDATRIVQLIRMERPGIWSFQDRFSDERLYEYAVYRALMSVLANNELKDADILPRELYDISTGIEPTKVGQDFKTALKKELATVPLTDPDPTKAKRHQRSMSYEAKREAEYFIDHRFDSLLALIRAFSAFLGSLPVGSDAPFVAFLAAWEQARTKHDRYSPEGFSLFFELLGAQLAEFALWICPQLKASSVKRFLKLLHTRRMLGSPTVIKIVAMLAGPSHLHALAGEEALKATSLIADEYEVDTRASQYARLARAMLPASPADSTAYFKTGLEQMDAIGAGDYQFTNELMEFASRVRGADLPDQDIQTLTNICELNMPDEEEKFAWFEFAKGLSRVAGPKTLAKLARWDDRSKIALAYTLLPYLTALVSEKKISPEDALALNRLADPVELYACDTSTLATAIDEKNYPNSKALFTELIEQFEVNNPGIPLGSTVRTLASIAKRLFGRSSDTAAYLSAAQEAFSSTRDELNENMNYHGSTDQQLSKRLASRNIQNHTALKALIAKTRPIEEASMRNAIDALTKISQFHDVRRDLFQRLRSKVAFGTRSQYVIIVAQLENLNIYSKLEELQTCKTAWGNSSVGLAATFEALGVPLLHLHAESFISFGQLSEGRLKELSDLTGVPIATLALELVSLFASTDSLSPASAWLGVAAVVCDKAAASDGRAALHRLLNSDSAKLASSVVDGTWRAGIYPANDIREVAAGLVWRMLGSPRAADRWRAAHSLRCFAKFKRWEMIDAIVRQYPREQAHPFQAPELPFYFMHARLWLLIALARIALDAPKEVARYQKFLLRICLDPSSTHVLIRHFAAEALVHCSRSNTFNLRPVVLPQLRDVNRSLFPRLKVKSRYDLALRERPEGKTKTKERFGLDYDFEKTYVDELARVFGKPKWQISDMISDVVRTFDRDVRGMYDTGTRQPDRSARYGGMTSKYHTYGQQLGWHGLLIVAGKLLSQFPVTEDSYNEDPWREFLRSWTITRSDGLWLSDGISRPPLATKLNLLAKSDKGLKITGDKFKIQALLGIDPKGKGKEVAVQGDWQSPDQIQVYIRSVLVKRSKARACARQLIQEEPFSVWLPVYDQYGESETHPTTAENAYVAWIVCPSADAMLDHDDPVGSINTVRRARFSDDIIKACFLQSDDAFKQMWKDSDGKLVGRSDAWGYKDLYSDGPDYSGTRLTCTQDFLKTLLSELDTDLLVLVTLRRYEKGIGHAEGRFSHTVAVLRIKKNMELEYYRGAINQYTRSWEDRQSIGKPTKQHRVSSR
jgi:hypothetical protein